MKEHNSNLHRLIKPLPNRPEIPIGFEVAWNVYENGYTGKTKHWFSESEVEGSEKWLKDESELMTNWLKNLNK